ncbi:hypothetical protein O9G_004440 [Rozella allomycis CSF55]|uniref:BED-type domain-containing protein n=1 Tax=Rozella allomycis (strain CSF55) TaxID=988480 RepID=A0A075AUA1_ROZAC|nr:hypothetical protein O9G_004440 [Rozella allomycis CSF55]|eukprot:EPZ33848.1 hypothetical protein O9G_004440 [Rozella allomycis CSF55]
MEKKPTNKDCVSVFFKSVEDKPHHYKCKSCNGEKMYKQNVKSGYGNLMNHLNSTHPNHKAETLKVLEGKIVTLDRYLDKDSVITHEWLRFLIRKDLPFSYCEDPDVRHACLSLEVEKNIKKLLKGAMGLVLDGWTENGIHYCGVFAVTSKNILLLGFSPLPDEESMNAAAHIEYLDFLLDVYNINAVDIKFIVGDNCSTNKAMCTRLGIPLIGCSSHRLNLAVMKFLEGKMALFSKVNKLMKKFKNSVNRRAKLAQYTHYRPVLMQKTRWSGPFSMLKRYEQIKSHLHHFQNDTIIEAEEGEANNEINDYRHCRLHVLVDTRKSLLAETLEAIMFLKLNDSHWTVHTVADALKALKLANNENDTANDENNKDSSDEDDDY